VEKDRASDQTRRRIPRKGGFAGRKGRVRNGCFCNHISSSLKGEKKRGEDDRENIRESRSNSAGKVRERKEGKRGGVRERGKFLEERGFLLPEQIKGGSDPKVGTGVSTI